MKSRQEGHAFDEDASSKQPLGHDVSPPPGLELIERKIDVDVSDMLHIPGDSIGLDDPSTVAGDLSNTTESKKSSSANVRVSRVLRLIHEALSCQEAAACADPEGFVSITKLMRLRPDLQRETFGSTRAIVSAVSGSTGGGLRLDKGHRRIRKQSADELVRAIAERDVESSSEGAIPLDQLLSSPDLRKSFQLVKDPVLFVQQALSHADSATIMRGSRVELRPRGLQLLRSAEELFSDEHLAHDSRLRSKLAESVGGAVPLTWLCARYVDRLGVAPPNGARETEVSAQELCDALKDSKLLTVDPRRLTVSRGTPYKTPLSPAVDVPASPASPNTPSTQIVAGIGKEARVAAQLRQLLDFYFEPFTLQHNRYLLDLLARRVGSPEERGPWVAEVLLGFHCSFQELKGLGRIASALAKTKASPKALYMESDELKNLKHLHMSEDGQLHLATPMEIRSFVGAEGASPEVVSDMVRYLAAAREQRGQAPSGTVSVVSYCVREVLADISVQGQQREARVKRQLLMHHADFVCLQGLDAEGRGEGLASTLSEDGYGFACAWDARGEANSIFWDRSRWEQSGSQECEAALAVDLCLIEDPAVKIRAVCLRPKVPYTGCASLHDVFDVPTTTPVVVCADLTLLGGAEGASIVEEIAYLPSVALEVLGEELTAPIAAPREGRPGEPLPLRAAASGLNKLRCPDAVLYRDLAPVAVLSGHTEGYMVTMAPDEVVKQFPAFRLPIVAAFDWRPCALGRAAAAAQTAASEPSQRIRI